MGEARHGGASPTALNSVNMLAEDLAEKLAGNGAANGYLLNAGTSMSGVR